MVPLAEEEKQVVHTALADLAGIIADKTMQDVCMVFRKGASDTLNVVKGSVAAITVIGQEVLGGVCSKLLKAIDVAIEWIEKEKSL
jgi:hypothetical protein